MRLRKTKRFTPKLLERFVRQGRGEGTHENFVPWHQVRRAEPSSRGRSHLLYYRRRLRHFLSNGELTQQYFATMLPKLHDCCEQYALSTDDSAHPLVRYGQSAPFATFPGTEFLAKELGIKHPKVTDQDDSTLWTATTDLLLVFAPANGLHRLLALAFKTNDWNSSRRSVQLLRLEREYWLRRGVLWLLITPKQSEPAVLRTLERIACWALADEAPAYLRQLACRISIEHHYRSVTEILQLLQAHTGSLESAQNALWQAVWLGELTIDLRRGWRPHMPLKHITRDEFISFNPIASGRSAWN